MRVGTRGLVAGLLLAAAMGGRVQADGLQPLGPADLNARIIGNTLAGQYRNGDGWREYFDPSGVIRGNDDTHGNYIAHFAVKGIYLCFDYDFPDTDWCGTLSIDGSEIILYRDDGRVLDPVYTILLKGNPYHL